METNKELQKRVNGFQKDLIKLLEKYDAGLFATLDQKCMVEFVDDFGVTEATRVIAMEDVDILNDANMYNYNYD